jgi:hypothetical protein
MFPQQTRRLVLRFTGTCFDLPTRINPLENSTLQPNLILFLKYAILFSYE